MAAQELSWLREWGSADEIWIRLHSTQTDFCFGQELGWYYTSNAWLQSERVIDVGTGSGHYLNRVASVFPEKDYHGIDVNDFFLEQAKRSFSRPNIRFDRIDLLDAQGQYDAAIVRLVMQHLSDTKAGLRKIGELLRPGGIAFLIDAADSFRYFYPELQEYVDFFKAYASAVKKEGKDRDIVARIPKLVGSTGHGLRCFSTETAIIPSTIPMNAPLFEETYYLVIELLEKTTMLAYDFNKVKRAWLNWCTLPRKYMQVGIRCVKLVRDGD